MNTKNEYVKFKFFYGSILLVMSALMWNYGMIYTSGIVTGIALSVIVLGAGDFFLAE